MVIGNRFPKIAIALLSVLGMLILVLMILGCIYGIKCLSNRIKSKKQTD